MSNVYQKLIDVQKELKAPKNQFNKFGGYNYRSCEDILEALKPILAKVKAITVLNDELVQIGERYYIKATAMFIDCESGEKIETSAYAREDETKKGMDLAQVTGSVSSYARKYALNGLFCIDDTKDSDFTNTHGKTKEDIATKKEEKAQAKAETKKIDELKLKALQEVIDKKKVDTIALCDFYKINSLADMTVPIWNHAMNYLKTKEDK